jgi:hypothetical protein
MKSGIIALAVFSAVLCSELPAQAQESDESVKKTKLFRIGIGTGIIHNVIAYEPFEYDSSPLNLKGATQIFIPIDVAFVRFEPEFAIQIIDLKFGRTEEQRTLKSIRIGAGLFGVKSFGESMRVYAGIRAVKIRSSSIYVAPPNSRNSASNTKTDVYIGPSIGGEYLIGEHFSVGIEAGLDYGRLGDFYDYDDTETKTLSTRTQVMARFYL